MNYLLAIFIAQMAADGVLTERVLHYGGYELNGWLAWLMRKIGVVPALLIAKVLPVAFVWYAIYVHQMPTGLLAAVEVLYTWVIYNNWKALQRQKGLK